MSTMSPCTIIQVHLQMRYRTVSSLAPASTIEILSILLHHFLTQPFRQPPKGDRREQNRPFFQGVSRLRFEKHIDHTPPSRATVHLGKILGHRREGTLGACRYGGESPFIALEDENLSLATPSHFESSLSRSSYEVSITPHIL
jgi:hypothetical protein